MWATITQKKKNLCQIQFIGVEASVAPHQRKREEKSIKMGMSNRDAMPILVCLLLCTGKMS